MLRNLSLVTCLVITTTALARDIYVSTAGDDSWSGGSPSQAWRTLDRVNRETIRPGDRILLEGGQTFTGSLRFLAPSGGTDAAPVKVTSFGSGRATIDARSGHGLLAYNTAGFDISNLRIIGSGSSSNTGSGIFFYIDLPGGVKLPHIFIDSVEVSGFGARLTSGWAESATGFGILIASGDGPSGYDNIRITNADVHDNAQGGISTFPWWPATQNPGMPFSNVYVAYSRAYNNAGVPGATLHTGSGILLQGVNGGTIEYCTAYGNGWLSSSTSGGPGGIWASIADKLVIQYNEAYSNRTGGTLDGGAFDLDGGVTNSIMQYNYSHDNDGSGYLLAQYAGVRPNSGNVVRYNISENDGRKNSFAGIQIWSAGTGVTNADIYNNTVYMSPAPTGQPKPIYFMNPTVNVRVRNNIFAVTGNLPLTLIAAGQKGVIFQGNDYWSATAPLRIQWQGATYSSLALWRSATAQEMLNGSPVGMNVDPGLQNPGKGASASPAYVSPETRLSALSPAAGYKLNSNSALLNAGLNLAQFGLTAAPTDFFGTSIYQDSGYEIGAYEQPGRLGQDVNGDRVVDCSDVMLVKAAYGSVQGSPNWNRFADVVTDGVINIRDLASVSQKLPAGTMCN